MRVTLDIEPDILALAKDIAASERSTAGAVLSKLARAGFQASGRQPSEEKNLRNGIEMLPKRGEPTSLSHVQRIMDDEGI